MTRDASKQPPASPGKVDDWASRVSLINPAFTERAKVDGFGLFTGQIGYPTGVAL
jgi:hypothetical protein